MYTAPQLTILDRAPKHSAVLYFVSASEALPKNAIAELKAHIKKHAALRGELGATLALHHNGGQFFYGLGKKETLTPQDAAEHGEAAGHWLQREGVSSVCIQLPEQLADRAIVVNLLKGLGLAGLRYDELKSKPAEETQKLEHISVLGSLLSAQDLSQLKALIEGVAFARILGELPPNIANPITIVEKFKKASEKKSISLEVWDEKRIAKEKMGLLQAVSAGSSIPPRFLIARYNGAPNTSQNRSRSQKSKGSSQSPTLFLVGKGITFDTGGINLKTTSWQDLLAMRRDMCGAAAVLGAILAIAQAKIPLSVVAVTPLTTNSIGSKATLPGDIIRSYSGQTVEIMNTDAEGRLILADALHYAVQHHADYIVDVATLTGACAIALGAHYSGLFTNHRAFGQQLLRCAERSGEPAWELPVTARYSAELKSDLADFANMGKTREGGASLGAAFLQKFVGDTPWVHFDIAGTDSLGGVAAAGAQIKTAGRMVHTLFELAREMAS